MALAAETTDQKKTAPHRHDSRQIANWFIRLAKERGQRMSLTRVLKLVYMAHGWSLAALDRPLINDQVEAWTHGPVIPGLYYAFRPQASGALKPLAMYEAPLDGDTETLLKQVYELYENLSLGQLIELTRIRGGPWDRTAKPWGSKFKTICEKLIAEHYKDKMARASGDG